MCMSVHTINLFSFKFDKNVYETYSQEISSHKLCSSSAGGRSKIAPWHNVHSNPKIDKKWVGLYIYITSTHLPHALQNCWLNGRFLLDIYELKRNKMNQILKGRRLDDLAEQNRVLRVNCLIYYLNVILKFFKKLMHKMKI